MEKIYFMAKGLTLKLWKCFELDRDGGCITLNNLDATKLLVFKWLILLY